MHGRVSRLAQLNWKVFFSRARFSRKGPMSVRSAVQKSGYSHTHIYSCMYAVSRADKTFESLENPVVHFESFFFCRLLISGRRSNRWLDSLRTGPANWQSRPTNVRNVWTPQAKNGWPEIFLVINRSSSAAPFFRKQTEKVGACTESLTTLKYFRRSLYRIMQVERPRNVTRKTEKIAENDLRIESNSRARVCVCVMHSTQLTRMCLSVVRPEASERWTQLVCVYFARPNAFFFLVRRPTERLVQFFVYCTYCSSRHRHRLLRAE